MPSSIIVLLHTQQLAAWQTLPGQSPAALPIKGETLLTVRDPRALADAYQDMADRLNGNDTPIDPQHTLWLADASGRQACSDAQLAAWTLPWEWLAQRFGLGTASPWEERDTLHQHILPWLITADDRAQRQHLQQLRQSEHRSETARLAAERNALARDNEHLRAQHAAVQQVDTERLLTFLPALFARVFTVIGAADLALLSGRIEPVSLPNPYPEPAEETLRTLQKRFRALPRSLQQQIVGFVTPLPQRQKLQPRPEMRELINELEGN